MELSHSFPADTDSTFADLPRAGGAGIQLRIRFIEESIEQFTKFSFCGGNRYLYGLFAGGPVTQGSRIGNLRTPAYATDLSFGTSY